MWKSRSCFEQWIFISCIGTPNRSNIQRCFDPSTGVRLEFVFDNYYAFARTAGFKAERLSFMLFHTSTGNYYHAHQGTCDRFSFNVIQLTECQFSLYIFLHRKIHRIIDGDFNIANRILCTLIVIFMVFMYIHKCEIIPRFSFICMT